MSRLDDIINSKDNLEVKRALAVKMYKEGFETKAICNLLNVSDSFVSKWKVIFEKEGAEGLRVNYQGGFGYLTDSERSDVIFYFSDKPHSSIEEVRDYIDRNYGIVFKSKQSYYDILKEAAFSWHRTQAANPKRDEAQVILERE